MNTWANVFGYMGSYKPFFDHSAGVRAEMQVQVLTQLLGLVEQSLVKMTGAGYDVG